MAPSSSSWTPSAGRHQLNIGSSLGRALRAQKSGTPGQQPAKRNILPEREFYSVRYRFKPSLIDSTKPGSLEVRRGSDASANTVTVEHASSQPGEIYAFPGSEVPSKEWICVLIYDEETGGYTLEKLESSIALGPPEKRTGTTRPSRSPSDSPPDTTATSSAHATAVDADFAEILPVSLLPTPTKPASVIVENDEDDIPLKMQAKAVPPPAPPAQRPRKTLPQKSNSEQQQKPIPSTSSAKTKTAPAATEKSKKPLKRSTPTFTDDESLESGRPAKRNRAPPAQPPPPPEPKRGPSPSRLELPGMSSAFVQPPPLPPSMVKSTSSSSSSLSSRTQPAVAQPSLESLSPLPPSADTDSEDEDEWEQIAAPISNPSVPIALEEEEAGEEIDVDALEDLMNAQMDEADDDEPDPEEDFLAMALPEEQPTPVLPRGPPISLKQFAGGDSVDEDDYTSSDDSDED